MNWDEIKLKNIALIILISSITSIVVSFFYITNASSVEKPYGFIGALFDFPNWLLYLPFLICIGLLIGCIFGIIITYLSNLTELSKIKKLNINASLLSFIFYQFIAIPSNLAYISSSKQHFAWYGLMGCIGDFIFLAIANFISFGFFIVCGFVVGGRIVYFFKKKCKNIVY